MAVTLISNPLGHKLAPTLYNATISSDGGDALVTHSSGVSNASWIYIESNIERYNGFKYVVQISPTTFKIRDQLGGDEIGFIQEADITFQISDLDHSWQSVHLPIVYELASNLFPLNEPEETYVPRTVSSFANYNGYVQLNLSSALSGPEELEHIELVGDGDLAGVYQIVTVIQPWSIVIDMAYESGMSFTGYHVLKYYNNYFITVQVYAGLDTGHRWEDEKPFELAGTLRLIPGSDNRVKFSISEILKGYINTRNNLTLDTLPNNLDFFTQFKISWFESYDETVDGEVTVFEGSVTNDSFRGNAVNSMMPFKSLNESFMSDYIDEGTQLARWLTLQDRPVAIVGYFFDLSFLLRHNGNVNVVIYKSSNGIVTDTEIIELIQPGTGVIRVPISIESGYDLYCVQVLMPGTDGYTPPAMDDFLTWTNIDQGPTYQPWVVNGGQVEINTDGLGLGVNSDIWATDYPLVAGNSYTFGYTFGNPSISASFRVGFLNSSNIMIVSSPVIPTPSSGTGSVTLVAITGAVKIGIIMNQGPSCSGSPGFCVQAISAFTNDTPSTPGADSFAITEQICITILEECDNTFTNDNLRITETDEMRALE